YGHNGADDVAAEAALIAKNVPGKHIRLQWMREDEHGWEPYGTAMLMKLKAGVDADGKITGWTYDLWSYGHSTRPHGNAGSLLPARYMEHSSPAPEGGFRGGATRNAVPYYELTDFELNSHIFSGPLRFSALRGLGAYANIFAIECFMDELAELSGKDPFEFRLSHLSDKRAAECLVRLRSRISSVQPSADEAIGIAFSRYKNSASYCAVAALVSVEENFRIRRMWAVVDSGEVINPDGLKNQIEGGMIQSASWALMEEVKFDKTHITSLNWNSYPILRFPEVPLVEVEIIDRPDEPPLGAGEAAQGPATAAIVNAVSRASGRRYRRLPLRLM
ncbi:MAG: molybdopterin-dependent oxidoreductase, partial [Cyclobacteriaceae bacterium]